MKIRVPPCMAAVIALLLVSCGELSLRADADSRAINGIGADVTHAFSVRSAKE